MNQSTCTTRSGFERLRQAGAQLFPACVGLWIAASLLKFGNPIILDHQIASPSGWWELIFSSWPLAWGHLIFALTFLTGLCAWRWHRPASSHWLCLCLPALWFLWQCVSSLQRTDPGDAPLITVTLSHFAVCVMSFYLGAFALSHGANRSLWIGVIGGWLIVVCVGWRQHFGGLAELREFFYSLPNWREQPPELIAKLSSDRIFSTLVYPNALAGAMLLFTPAIIAAAWIAPGTAPPWQRVAGAGVCLMGALGCLFWSGSKGGWVIALGLGALVFLLCVKKLHLRIAIVAILLIVGLTGFWVRYRDYFERGATSVSARFDYWNVAVANVREQPWLGSGPGTFLNVYRRLKPPNAEMTRLVHNDYLEQATDSGVIGGVLFATFVVTALVAGYRNIRDDLMRLGVWVGILGMAVQSLSEFGLYIPALAWPWFLAMGALAGTPKPSKTVKTVDKGSRCS